MLISNHGLSTVLGAAEVRGLVVYRSSLAGEQLLYFTRGHAPGSVGDCCRISPAGNFAGVHTCLSGFLAQRSYRAIFPPQNGDRVVVEVLDGVEVGHLVDFLIAQAHVVQLPEGVLWRHGPGAVGVRIVTFEHDVFDAYQVAIAQPALILNKTGEEVLLTPL